MARNGVAASWASPVAQSNPEQQLANAVTDVHGARLCPCHMAAGVLSSVVHPRGVHGDYSGT
jgi:hypothetical protein